MNDTAPLAELAEVTKSFASIEGGGEAAAVVLRSVDLVVAPGESVAIVGPSGSGKSTLLNILGALQRPTSGTVRVNGVDLAGLDSDGLAALRNRALGFVFQAHHLLPQLSALENVLVPTLVTGNKEARRRAVERARHLLADVGLGERMAHRPGQLSGGECQRVAVVRALINEPRLLLADEPTGSLDRAAADDLGDLLCELNRRESVALVVVTHSERLAARMGRELELRDGKLHALEDTR
ncbi:MAG: ABC transporter ATP-binding protein [Planctomycetota bacterium]|nr:ABC transporter ATP-binding protein [Planctomycetota bacterium]